MKKKKYIAKDGDKVAPLVTSDKKLYDKRKKEYEDSTYLHKNLSTYFNKNIDNYVEKNTVPFNRYATKITPGVKTESADVVDKRSKAFQENILPLEGKLLSNINNNLKTNDINYYLSEPSLYQSKEIEDRVVGHYNAPEYQKVGKDHKWINAPLNNKDFIPEFPAPVQEVTYKDKAKRIKKKEKEDDNKPYDDNYNIETIDPFTGNTNIEHYNSRKEQKDAMKGTYKQKQENGGKTVKYITKGKKFTRDYARKALEGDVIPGATSIGGTGVIQPVGGLPTRDTEAGMNAVGPEGQQNIYQAQNQYDKSYTIAGQPGNVPGSGPEGMDMEMDDPNQPQPIEEQETSEEQAQETAPQGDKPKRKNRFGNAVGKMLNGVKSTDVVAGIAQGVNALIPNKPVRDNKKKLIDAYNPNPLGTGSHAAFADGGVVPQPVTPQERDQWEAAQSVAYQQGYTGNDHNQQQGANFLQTQGVDPTRLAAIQQDFQNKQGTDQIRAGAEGLSKVDNFYGHKTSQQRYRHYEFQHQDAKGNVIDKQNFGTDVDKRNAYVNNALGKNVSSQTNESQGFGNPKADLNYKAPNNTGFGAIPQGVSPDAPKGLKATGFPTLEEAKAKARTTPKEQKSNWYTKDKSGGYGENGIKLYEGGFIQPQGEEGLYVDGGAAMNIGQNGETGDTLEFVGPKHTKGGIDINYAGKPVEVEGGETAFVNKEGNLNVLGNLTIPGTSKKFKNAGKDIAKQEQKISKMKDKATHLVTTSDPKDKFYSTRFNTGKVMQDAIAQKETAIADTKEYLADIQNHILEKADKMGIEPKELTKMYSKAKYGIRIQKAKDGFRFDEEPVEKEDEKIPYAAYASNMPKINYDETEGVPEDDSTLPGPYVPNDHGVEYVDMSHITNKDPEEWRKGQTDTEANQSLLNRDKTKNFAEKKPNEKGTDKTKFSGMRNRLGISDVLPELSTIFEKVEPVGSQQLNPTLKNAYQVSFDDRMAANQGDFNALEKTLAHNPAALGALSAQKYNINNSTRADEFRVNQGIIADTTNTNVGIINQAKEMNIKLADEQMVRQAQAKANTEDNRFRASESLADKVSKIKHDNNTLGIYEGMEHYVIDKNGTPHFIGPDHEFMPQRVGISNVTNPKKESHTKKRKSEDEDNTYTEKDYFGGKIASRKPSQKKKYIAK